MRPSILPLFLGCALATIRLQAGEPARYLITDRGAKADGVTVNTAAIQATIDACAAGPGGVVVVPAGTFLSGSVFLKSHVTLQLETGAVLKGTINPEDFPQIPTRWEGIEREWTAALVNAVGASDVAITGPGTIDGSGTAWPRPIRERPLGAAPLAGEPGRDETRVTKPGATAANKETGPKAAAFPRRGRPRLIVFQNCHKVSVRGIHLLNQSSWGLVFIYCDGARAEGLNIRAEHHIPSSDGIDIDSSRHVVVTGCDIDVNDDCISIKSGKDEEGRRINRPSEDILVERTRFGYGHGGVAMGSETSGGIRRVEVRDCVFEEDNWAPVRFKSQPSRGGVVEDITYRNLTLRHTRQAVEFNLAWRMVPPVAPPAPVLPVVRRIRLINLTGTVGSAGIIEGLPGSPIRDVSFEGCVLTAEKPLVLVHTLDVSLDGLKLAGVAGDPVVRR
jgi:polygalacturonase